MHARLSLLFLTVLPASCTAPRTANYPAQHRAEWEAPPLERAVSVRNGHTGASLSFDALLDDLAQADAVFLGETHLDETTHRVELAIYEGLLERRSAGVVLAMEMFQRDAQTHLDAYLQGQIDELAFLKAVHVWPNYKTAYRPLIERAKAAGRPVIASNFPRSLQRRITMQGPEILDGLQGDEKRLAPLSLIPNTPAYWRRVDNAVRGHRAMMPKRDTDDKRLYSAQTLWDNSMGESCALALEQNPGSLVLHINGAFHSAYWDGTVRQFSIRKPTAVVKTVAIVPASNPAISEAGGKPIADYLVFAEARASDLKNGTWSVHVSREIRYRFHLPSDSTPKDPVPLLIWLSDDGFTASDGLQLWKDRLGKQTAIAVIEAPYRGTQRDLSVGGRWFWADTFAEDIGILSTAVERTWAYLLRHFPIDPNRVCLAGEGTGATVVGAIALLTDRISAEAICLSPRRYAKIGDFPLPLPELKGDDIVADKSLVIVTGEDDRQWWTEELQEFGKVGLDGRWVQASSDPWHTERQAEALVRDALGLVPRPAPQSSTRYHLLVESESSRERHWARLWANRIDTERDAPVAVLKSSPVDSMSELISTHIYPEEIAAAQVLPRCPGPFGGTTVLVLPHDTPDDDVAVWIALEENDPLNRKSRFHRLRIATADGPRNLPATLATLLTENRKNVLVVPAMFCADGSMMEALKRSVQEYENRMTIRWLPGLGGQNIPVSVQG